MEDLLVVGLVAFDREQAVAAATQCIGEGRHREQQQGVAMQSFDAAAIVQQLACGEIAVDDMAGSIEQQHRHRGVLHHRVQQQFALRQGQPLFAQGVAKGVVGAHQIGEFAVSAISAGAQRARRCSTSAPASREGTSMCTCVPVTY